MPPSASRARLPVAVTAALPSLASLRTFQARNFPRYLETPARLLQGPGNRA